VKDVLVALPRIQDTRREVGVMNGVREVLCLEAESTVHVVGLTLLTRQAHRLRQKVP